MNLKCIQLTSKLLSNDFMFRIFKVQWFGISMISDHEDLGLQLADQDTLVQIAGMQTPKFKLGRLPSLRKDIKDVVQLYTMISVDIMHVIHTIRTYDM